MYSCIIKTLAIGINILVALVTVASLPVKAQYSSNPIDLNQSNQFFNTGTEIKSVNAQSLPNFTDLNQSSQFFLEGNKQIEQEIKLLQQDLKLPKKRSCNRPQYKE